MEVDEIHRKFPRTANGKLGHKMDEEDDGEKSGKRAAAAAAADLGGGLSRFYGWPSSRIVRVSRASGGKDRHSKVLTSKGLRDRRVRLSVNTAIQFYDLQDRLGYDQPSKAVEWLLKAAAASIAELPPITTPFPETPRQVSDEKRSSSVDHLCFDSADPNKFSQPPAAPPPQAVCSSTSETSKGSGLSLSRSESRIKARERAKGRVLAERGEKESECCNVSMNPISQTTSFTELLNGGIINGNNRQWSSSTPPMDYFAGNPFTFGSHQNFSFLSDLGNHHHHHHNNNNNQNNGEYNLNFTISSSSAENPSGFNRGTLQSNSAPPQLPHFQRYDNNNNNNDNNSSSNNNNNNPDGSTQGFYIGHHQFQSGYDSRLQLCYGGDDHGNTTGTNNDNNGSRPSKGRN